MNKASKSSSLTKLKTDSVLKLCDNSFLKAFKKLGTEFELHRSIRKYNLY